MLCSIWIQFFIYFQESSSSRVQVVFTSRENLKRRKVGKSTTTSFATGLSVSDEAHYLLPYPFQIYLDCFWWPTRWPTQINIPEACPTVIMTLSYWVYCTCPFMITIGQGSTKTYQGGSPGYQPDSSLSLLCNTTLHSSDEQGQSLQYDVLF